MVTLLHPLCRLAALLLTAILMLSTFCLAAQAAETGERVVTVGYMGQGSVRRAEDGTYSGYTVDYLEEIGRQTGWTYEYVYGNWAELLDKLDAGEIDLIGMVRHTEERAETLVYSHLSMAHDYTAICAPVDCGIYYQDYAAFDGCSVAVVSDTIHEESFIRYAQEHGFAYKLVHFPTIGEAEQAVLEGSVDLLITSGIASHGNLKEVDQFGLERTYLVTGPQNRALMEELDTAVQMIRIQNPGLEHDLTQQYFDDENTPIDLYLTKEEQNYLETVGPVVVLGYDGRRPLGYTNESGEFVGVLADYLNALGEISGLEFVHSKADAGTLQENVEQVIERGCAILFIDQDLDALGLKDKLCKTEPLFETGLAYIKRKDDVGNTGRKDLVFAVNKEMAYLEEMLLDASGEYTILWCEDSVESLEAVSESRADVAIQDEHIADFLLQKPEFAETLREVVGWQLVEGMCLYAPMEHAPLVRILNKTINSLTEVRRSNLVTDATLAHSYEYSMEDVLYDYGKSILLVGALAFAVLFLSFRLYIRVNKYRLQEQEKRQLQERLQTDELTGAYSRSYFLERAREMIDRSGDDIYIVRLNICRFKLVNELYGPGKGDHLLREMGRDLKAMGEASGFLVGRFSADRFYLCIRKKDFDAVEFPRSAPAPWLGIDIRLSYGVYPVRMQKEIPVSVMCDHANMASASTAQDPTEYIHFYSERAYRQLHMEQEIESEMEQALVERQFCIHIQPKVDIETGRITGGEALVRWQHPIKGMIPPYQFVGLFERNGFITKLDQYVWEECCQFQVKLREMGLPILPVSVNVSRAHFYSSELVGTLTGLLERYDLEASALELEITESICAEDPVLFCSQCERLRNMGFQIAMDDFGSGYSSLNMLKEMPLDIIKMDVRFLSGEKNEEQLEKGKLILRTLIELAQRLELKVVVEGVETEEQRDYIREIGHCTAQGYFYAKPMPSEEFQAMLVSQSQTVCP